MCLNLVFGIATAIATIAIAIATLFAARSAARAANSAAHSARETAQAWRVESFIHVVQSFSDERWNEAEKLLYENAKDAKELGPGEQDAANKAKDLVGSRMSMATTLNRQEALPEGWLDEHFGKRIERLWLIIKRHVEQRRTSECVPNLYANIEDFLENAGLAH